MAEFYASVRMQLSLPDDNCLHPNASIKMCGMVAMGLIGGIAAADCGGRAADRIVFSRIFRHDHLSQIQGFAVPNWAKHWRRRGYFEGPVAVETALMKPKLLKTLDINAGFKQNVVRTTS
jgi:hypothetical protein